MIEGQKDSEAGEVDKVRRKDSLTREGRDEEKKKEKKVVDTKMR